MKYDEIKKDILDLNRLSYNKIAKKNNVSINVVYEILRELKEQGYKISSITNEKSKYEILYRKIKPELVGKNMDITKTDFALKHNLKKYNVDYFSDKYSIIFKEENKDCKRLKPVEKYISNNKVHLNIAQISDMTGLSKNYCWKILKRNNLSFLKKAEEESLRKKYKDVFLYLENGGVRKNIKLRNKFYISYYTANKILETFNKNNNDVL